MKYTFIYKNGTLNYNRFNTVEEAEADMLNAMNSENLRPIIDCLVELDEDCEYMRLRAEYNDINYKDFWDFGDKERLETLRNRLEELEAIGKSGIRRLA